MHIYTCNELLESLFGGINLKNDMNDLFKSVTLNNLEIRNRFVMAAAADNLSDELGRVTNSQVKRLSDIAKGGVGLIITGGIGVNESGRSSKGSPSLSSDDRIKDYKLLTQGVHENGGKIMAQLCHSGVWTSTYQNKLGYESIAPSILPKDNNYHNNSLLGDVGNYHSASHDEIEITVQAFAKAAIRAKKAGFDGIEVHGAHDSLLSQFLSPVTNIRTDDWGGSVENRCKIHCSVGDSIRNMVGDDFPVILKLGVIDGIDNGLLLEDSKIAGKLALNNGFNLLEISQGLQGGKFNETVFRPVPKDGSGYFRDYCKDIKQSIGVDTILTGGIRSLDMVKDMITNKETDLIGICRPLIREPNLIKRWQSGDNDNSTCISCNKCVIALGEGKPLKCCVDIKYNQFTLIFVLILFLN